MVKPYVALIGAVALLIYLRKDKRALIQLGKLIAAGAMTLLLGLLPFLIAAPQMVLAHLDTLLTLPGWSSPYALIDGVIKHVDPKVADRFDVALAASPIVPSRIPWGIVTLAFGVIYLVILWRAIKRVCVIARAAPTGLRSNLRRPMRLLRQPPRFAMTRSARTAIGLAALTFIFYLLWSKGFSPQWVLYLIAFLCILLPNFLGTVLIALLEALYVIEWPITFILLNADPRYLTALVIVRTAYIVGTGAVLRSSDLHRRCIRHAGKRRSAGPRSAVSPPCCRLSCWRWRHCRCTPRNAIKPIRCGRRSNSSRIDPRPIAPTSFSIAWIPTERLAPFLPGWSSMAALQLGGKADEWSEQKIQSFSTEKPELWYVLDFGAEQKADQRQAIDRKLSETLCKVSREFAGSAQVSHFVNAPPDREVEATATFENGLQLDRARISNTTLKPGDPICLELQWSTTSRLPTDYTVFVHVLDQNGQLVAQSDLQPGGGYAPTSGWPIGQPITDRHGVVLPPTLAPGDLPDRHRPVRAGWRAAQIEHGGRSDRVERVTIQ